MYAIEGPQIGKAAESLAQLQQPRFRPSIGRQCVEFITAHSAQQHRVAFESRFQGLCREWGTALANGDAADRHFGKLEIVAAELCNRPQDAHRFARHFRPDSISCADQHFQFHFSLPLPRICGAGFLKATTSHPLRKRGLLQTNEPIAQQSFRRPGRVLWNHGDQVLVENGLTVVRQLIEAVINNFNVRRVEIMTEFFQTMR